MSKQLYKFSQERTETFRKILKKERKQYSNYVINRLPKYFDRFKNG